MADCALCGDPELSHQETSPGSWHLGRCTARTLLKPPCSLLPDGNWEECDCPGYEAAPEDEPGDEHVADRIEELPGAIPLDFQYGEFNA